MSKVWNCNWVSVIPSIDSFRTIVSTTTLRQINSCIHIRMYIPFMTCQRWNKKFVKLCLHFYSWYSLNTHLWMLVKILFVPTLCSKLFFWGLKRTLIELVYCQCKSRHVSKLGWVWWSPFTGKAPIFWNFCREFAFTSKKAVFYRLWISGSGTPEVSMLGAGRTLWGTTCNRFKLFCWRIITIRANW